MNFRTIVDIARADFQLAPCQEVLLVGSCFANGIGRRFQENGFPTTVNPYGTMYNPVSVLHTVERWLAQLPEGKAAPGMVFLTMGTNHVYRLRETGEIVDNCQKRPPALFQEEELTVDECAGCLLQTIDLLRKRQPDVRVVLTVSPIRYRKYGYHGSQLSKATLLLAVQHVVRTQPGCAAYFPAYELLTDELRDYRFYAPDMIHPTDQAVDYIWERLTDYCFSAEAKAFLAEWQPIRQALNHRPLNPDSDEYRQFMDKTMLKVAAMRKKYPTFAL